jgi:hypothetical protein
MLISVFMGYLLSDWGEGDKVAEGLSGRIVVQRGTAASAVVVYVAVQLVVFDVTQISNGRVNRNASGQTEDQQKADQVFHGFCSCGLCAGW